MLLPAYLRSVDESVVVRAGAPTRSVLAEASEQARLDKPGLAMNLVRAAKLADVPGADRAVEELQRQLAGSPVSPVWGGTDSLLQQVCGGAGLNTPADSVLAVLLPAKQRAAALRFLQGLRRGDVQELLRNRDFKEPSVFPPVTSASGQALDAGILLTGLLMQADAFRPALRQEIERQAAMANRGGGSAGIELVYLNLSSLAKRMTWDQLVWFLGRVRDLSALRDLTAAITRSPATNLPVIFSALLMAESPDAVVDYVRRLPKTALTDLRLALKAGKGGLDLLLARQQPIVAMAWRESLGSLPLISVVWSALVGLSSASTFLALLLKYLLWFDGAFCLARAYSLLRPEPSALEAPLQVAGMRTLRHQTIGILAVAVAFVLTEPGLARIHTPIQPAVWVATKKTTAPPAETATPKPSMKYESNYLALGLFFAVQAAVYIIGLIKLREIKRQEIASALKIRILDNEENLFDTGLYVGLGGTGFSLVLMALNLFEASPMIAYASTGFGVFFASLLKIVHVRSYRRRLIMEADLEHAPAAP